ELWRYEHGETVTAPLTEGLEPEAADDLHPTSPHPREPERALPLTHARGRGWLVAGLGVAWVLTFGALVAVGIPLANYRNGNGNILGDRAIPHWFAGHRADALGHITIVGSEVGNTHSIM